MPPYSRHVFVCTNRRPDGHPKGDCAHKGGEAVTQKFKEAMAQRGLKGGMRANSSGCLDTCAFGVSVVVYPEGTWYAGVKAEDVDEIVEQHLVGGKPVDRLLMKTKPAPSK